MTPDDITSEEQSVADLLTGLVSDPSPERRARIIAAYRAAPSPQPAWISPWRVPLAAAAAVLILMVGSVGAVAASGNALPSSPNYSLRGLGERVRLTLADAPSRERLRISFAQSRISQAWMVLEQGDRTDAQGLLRDSRAYLNDTRQELGNVPSGEQGQVQNELNQTQDQQNQAEGQLNQQGQNGG